MQMQKVIPALWLGEYPTAYYFMMCTDPVQKSWLRYGRRGKEPRV